MAVMQPGDYQVARSVLNHTNNDIMARVSIDQHGTATITPRRPGKNKVQFSQDWQ